MRKTLLIIVLFFCTYNLFSQQDSLLKKFKYRIGHYQAFNFNINAGGNFEKSEHTIGDQKNTSSSGALGAFYYSVKSTDRILLTTSASLGTSYSSGKTDYSTSIYKNSSFSVAPAFNILNKWFSKNMFSELGTDLSSSLYYNKNKEGIFPATREDKQAQYTVAINTGIGKGRLENITDMQNALWLYKELASGNSLSRSLTADEQIELGQTITKANNTRVLDSRRRTKYILSTVDNYLQQKGVINKTDIQYFSSLNDILFFAFNNPRLSGTEKYIRLRPSVTGWNNDVKQNDAINKYEHRAYAKSVLLSAGLNNYKPINLVHQSNYGASIKLSYDDLDLTDRYFTSGTPTTEIKSGNTIKKAAANLFFEHAIYPNTRTTINLRLQTEGGYQDINKETSLFGTIDMNGSLNYFISYQTRLTVNLGVAYQRNVYRVNQYLDLFPNNIQLYANAGLNISL